MTSIQAINSKPIINFKLILLKLMNTEVQKLSCVPHLQNVVSKQYPLHDPLLAWYEHPQDEVFHNVSLEGIEAFFHNGEIRYKMRTYVRPFLNGDVQDGVLYNYTLPKWFVSRISNNYPEMWEALLAK